MRIINSIILLLFFAIALNAFQKEHSAIEIKAPSDWRPETINFPLDFAPQIAYKGVEELRFAPGMFKPATNTYFTYLFVWDLQGKQPIDSEILSQALTSYFKGLCKEVGEARQIKMDLDKVAAEVTPGENSAINSAINKEKYQKIFRAKVTAFDPFNKGEALKLNIEIVLLNTDKDKTVLFYCVSPKSFDDEIWKQLYEIRDSFQLK